MKKLTVLSVVAASLLLIGCGEEAKQAAKEATSSVAEKTAAAAEATKEATSSAVEATKEAASNAAEKATEVAKDAKEAVAEKAEEAKEAVEEKAKEATEAASSAAATVNLSACVACHGANFEKVAMGVSKVVKDMTKDEIIASLKGYQDGSYGGNMKALMKGQVAGWDDAKIEAAAAQIAGK